jgi:hypothetical protein
VLGRNYFSKGIRKMMQIRYWFNRTFLLGALVVASATAAGWKWDRGLH